MRNVKGDSTSNVMRLKTLDANIKVDIFGTIFHQHGFEWKKVLRSFAKRAPVLRYRDIKRNKKKHYLVNTVTVS